MKGKLLRIRFGTQQAKRDFKQSLPLTSEELTASCWFMTSLIDSLSKDWKSIITEFAVMKERMP